MVPVSVGRNRSFRCFSLRGLDGKGRDYPRGRDSPAAILGWDPIIIPQVDSDPVAHPYVYSQFFPWVGGLELDGKSPALDRSTNVPPTENHCVCHIATLDSQILLDAMSEDGGALRSGFAIVNFSMI